MADEKRVRQLWSCAQLLSTETHAERLLKSFYINTCRKLAKKNAQLPDDCVGTARMCSRCGNQWSDGNYQLHLQPQRLAANAKRRRQVAKLDTIKAKREKGKLSRGARMRAKWLKKRMASKIAVDCTFCGHNTMLALEKPKIRCKSAMATLPETMAMPTAATKTTTRTLPPAGSKKKNKKNNNINAGLKAPQRQQQQQQPQTSTSTVQQAAAIKAPARSTSVTTTKTPAKQAPTTKSTSAANSKQKQKSKAAQSTTSKPTAPKVQSKTQKQNALLLLAAQLKANASKNASKTPQNRLQSFLK